MTLNRVLLVVAVVLFVVAWLLSAGAIDGSNPSTWGYAGLALFAASFVP
jgi:hypothetical protein